MIVGSSHGVVVRGGGGGDVSAGGHLIGEFVGRHVAGLDVIGDSLLLDWGQNGVRVG